jgi:hypothetical protein
MATKVKKIPQLNLASYVASPDLFVINQNGITKRATFALLKDTITRDFEHARDIQLRKTDQYIQWRYVGDLMWTNLVPLSELQGPPGLGSTTQTVFTADGVKKIFNGISGISSNNALKCIVTVGGATQEPGISYTVSTENNGSVIFDEAPPANLAITVCVFQ